MIHRVFFFSIILFGIFLLFFRLGFTYLVSFDEAFYAVIAKELFQHGNMLMLTFGGERFLAVSPLYIWLETLWFILFGPSEFGVRFFAAASSLGTITAILIFFGRRRFVSGFIATLVLLSTVKFLFLSRTGNLDATLTFFTTLALLFSYHSVFKRRFFILLGLTSGLAFLTKGLFGLLPLVFFSLYALIFKRQILRSPWFISVLLVFFLVILPWHLLEYRLYGFDFFQAYYGGYMATKIGASTLLSRLWWGSGLWQGMKVWFLISILGIIYGLVQKKIWRRIHFFTFAIIVYLVGLSLIQTHNDWYLMPLYPIFAIIIGEVFSGLLVQSSAKFILFPSFILLVLFHLVYYRHQYIVPQTTDAQVLMIKEAERFSPNDTPILLDDFYYPVAMYYSNRPIVRLRANRDSAAAISSETLNRYLSNHSVLLTNTTTASSATRAASLPLTLRKVHGELLLFSLEPRHDKIRQWIKTITHRK